MTKTMEPNVVYEMCIWNEFSHGNLLLDLETFWFMFLC